MRFCTVTSDRQRECACVSICYICALAQHTISFAIICEFVRMKGDIDMSKILIIEDDAAIAELEKDYLELSDFEVAIESDGSSGAAHAVDEDFDLILLDLMLPGMDGFEICKYIREKKDTPILMVSAKKDDIDKIRGLGLGADDYITKPFSPSELIARVNSQLRRYHSFGGVESKTSDVVNIENLWMDKSLHEVKAYGNPVKLTPIEFDILFLMASHPNKVFSTDEIFERVWKEKSFEMSNTVMVHIRRLREKIESGSDKSKIIKTVWGVGYKIEA